MESETMVQIGTGSVDDPIVLSSDEEQIPEETSSKQMDQVVNSSAPSANHDDINGERASVVHSSDCDQLFNKFVDTCFLLDNSSTMLKVVELKVKKHYSRLIPEYCRSDEFRQLIEKTEAEIIRCPNHLYRNLKYFIDEMKNHRSKINVDSEDTPVDEHVRKLHTALKYLQFQIKALEKEEVLWNDEGKSSYLKLQLYRKRIVKVYSKLQEIEGKSTSLFERKITFSGTQFPSVNKAIEKYCNTIKEFPCYNEILDVLKLTYKNEGIKIPNEKMHSEAKSVFTNLGEQLQKRRQFEYWEAHSAYLDGSTDPAEEDMKLRSALEENRTVYGSRIDDIIDTFARDACTSPAKRTPQKKSSERVIQSQENPLNRKQMEKEEDKEQDNHNSDQRNAVGGEYKKELSDGIITEGVDESYIRSAFPTELSDSEVDTDNSEWSRPFMGFVDSEFPCELAVAEFSGCSETEDETRLGCSAWADERSVDSSIVGKLRIFNNFIQTQEERELRNHVCQSPSDKEPEIVMLD